MSENLRNILNSHPVVRLRSEIRKVMRDVKRATRQEVVLYFKGISRMTKPMLINFMMQEPQFYTHLTARVVVRKPRKPRKPRATRETTIPAMMGMGLSGGSRNARNSANLGNAFRRSLLNQTSH